MMLQPTIQGYLAHKKLRPPMMGMRAALLLLLLAASANVSGATNTSASPRCDENKCVSFMDDGCCVSKADDKHPEAACHFDYKVKMTDEGLLLLLYSRYRS